MNDWNIIGHDWAVRQLSRAFDSGQLAQSHLLVGSASLGKAALARELARVVLMSGARDQARASKLVSNLKHPDLSWIEPATEQVLVEQVRDLMHSLSLAPVESRYRVGVINSFHLANLNAQNAFLKTLEEPNARVIIVLVALNLDSVLPTIASRCQVLSLRAVSAQDIRSALVARAVEPAKADLVARLAQGRPGWAIRATESAELLEQRAQWLQDLEALLSANRTRRFEYAEKLSTEGADTIQAVLGEWLVYWRDVARAASMPDSSKLREQIMNVDYIDSITNLGASISPHAAAQMVRLVVGTRKYIQQNVRARLALDGLMLKMGQIVNR